MSQNNRDDEFPGARGIGGFGFAIDGSLLQEKAAAETLESAIDQVREEMTSQELMLVLIDKVDKLEAKLELVFGNHVFIKGRLIDLERND